MEPALIVFGIKSLVRCCSVGQKALEQAARDQGAIFPDLIKLDLSKKDVIFSILIGEEYTKKIFAENNLDMGLIDRAQNDDALAIETLFLLTVKLKAEESVDVWSWMDSNSSRAGATLMKQWSADKAPATPLTRFMLTAADIALEYAAIHPQLPNGGETKKLFAAFAGNLGKFIDDEGKFGKQHDLFRRLSAGFLRAGLQVIGENPQWISAEKHLQEFFTATTEPLLSALPDSLADSLNVQQVVETLSGPVFKAALDSIAQNQVQFLGDGLTTSKALGALAQATLRCATGKNFHQLFSKESLLTIYQALLEVAARQPQLFIENDGSAKDQVIEQLFVGASEILSKNSTHLGRELATQLTSLAITTAANNLPAVASDAAWSSTSVKLAATLLHNLDGVLKNNQPIKQIFSYQQWRELSRILLRSIAETPAMIIGREEQFGGVVTAVATAMASDTHLLLHSSAWLNIAEVAAREAASNPGRLFRLNLQKPSEMLATQLISLLINAGAESLSSHNKAGVVLYGDTLQQAITISIQACSGNMQGLADNLDSLKSMVRDLTNIVAENQSRLGSKEWLLAFSHMLTEVLQGKLPSPITLEKILEICAPKLQ